MHIPKLTKWPTEKREYCLFVFFVVFTKANEKKERMSKVFKLFVFDYIMAWSYQIYAVFDTVCELYFLIFCY